MKVLISADIEGVTGIAHWDEAGKAKPEYQEYRRQMTREVAAACRGALAGGATEILVKDAHATGRNLLHEELPEEVRLVRGWAGDPLCMTQGLDESFAAVMMVGYHSPAASRGNVLAHTLTGGLHEVLLEGRRASEFWLHARAAATLGVPVVLVTGDATLGEHVKAVHPPIHTVAVGQGVGDSTVSEHPARTVREIERAAEEAMKGDRAACVVPQPERHELTLRFKIAPPAYRASHYPGMERLDDTTVRLVSEDYMDLMRALQFTT